MPCSLRICNSDCGWEVPAGGMITFTAGYQTQTYACVIQIWFLWLVLMFSSHSPDPSGAHPVLHRYTSISKRKINTDTSHQEAQLSKEMITIPCMNDCYKERNISHLEAYWTIHPLMQFLYTQQCKAPVCSSNRDVAPGTNGSMSIHK